MNDDEMIGVKILQKAMRSTFSTILENADENPAIYLKELKDAEITDGYDVAKMCFESSQEELNKTIYCGWRNRDPPD